MEEPLTNSRPDISFAGKFFNNHPQWHNQPLRLTKEQKQNPLPVLDDFFECYHLNDVRKTLWEWTTEILSSPCSISIEPQHRNDHIYFYEKIETIIEAAFVIKRRIHKQRRRREKRLLKKTNHRQQNPNITNPEKTEHQIPVNKIALADNTNTFDKPKHLIEYVNENPRYVISQIFNKESLTDLMNQLDDWLFIALSADCNIYEEGELRGQLLTFKEQLMLLIEALFICHKQNCKNEDNDKEISENDITRLLTQKQIANPMQVMATFFEKFSMIYIIRELEDWLEASICFSGTPPENMHELQALWTYRNVLCLVKSAKRLLCQ